MSWSINFIGTTTKIVTALQKESERLTGTSKEEFDNALPHLTGLVQLNYNQSIEQDSVLKLTASGHGGTIGTGAKYNSVSASIEYVGSTLL